MAEEAQRLTLEAVDKMNYQQLKDELVKRNINIQGRKVLLKHKLMSVVLKETEENQDAEDIEVINEDMTTENEVTSDRGIEESSVVSDDGSIYNGNNYNRIKAVKMPCFSFHDVEDSLDSFSGDNKISVERWVEDVENVATIAGWTEQEKLIYGKKLLSGAAKQFIRTKKDVTSWNKLRNSLIAEFHVTVTARDVHEQLRRRSKKPDESSRG